MKKSLIRSLYLHPVRIFLTPFVQIIGGIANSRSRFLVLHYVHDVKRAESVFKDTSKPEFNNNERRGIVSHMCGLVFLMSADESVADIFCLRNKCGILSSELRRMSR